MIDLIRDYLELQVELPGAGRKEILSAVHTAKRLREKQRRPCSKTAGPVAPYTTRHFLLTNQQLGYIGKRGAFLSAFSLAWSPYIQLPKYSSGKYLDSRIDTPSSPRTRDQRTHLDLSPNIYHHLDI